MKVYELMNKLANFPSGKEIQIGLCITKQKLMTGEEIESDMYSLRLNISEILGDGTIYTESP